MLRFALAFLFLWPLSATLVTDLAEAKKVAASEGKDIYLVFTSLKVSGACVQLNQRVISQEDFHEAVSARFVIAHLDVPLDDAAQSDNQVTALKFGVTRYPTALFLDAQGVVYDREAGALRGSPQEYAVRLIGQSDAHQARLATLEKAYQNKGLDRARALVSGIKAVPAEADPAFIEKHLEALRKADPDDSLGFQKQRRAEQGFLELDLALKEVFDKDSHLEVAELIDEYLAKFSPDGAFLQKALFPKLAALNHAQETAQAIKVAEAIIAVDAESSHGKFATQILKQLKSR